MKYKIKKMLISNWFAATLLTLLVLAGMMLNFYPMQFVEWQFYDFLTGLRHRQLNSPVLLVQIDEKSIDEIGNWPWPRSVLADGINRISRHQPKVMGIHLLFPGPRLNIGLTEVREVRNALKKDPFLKKRKSRYKIDRMLAAAEKEMNHDALLINAVNYSKNVVLPIRFFLKNDGRSPNSGEIPDWLERHSMLPDKFSRWQSRGPFSLNAGSVLPTFEDLARRAGALGHTNVVADRDGTVRAAPLLIRYQGRYFPSFALQVVAKYTGGGLEDIQPDESGLKLKRFDIPTDSDYRMLIDFGGSDSHLERVSFSDVLSGKAPGTLFKDKIVLLGNTLSWEASTYRTPAGGTSTGLGVTAEVVENIIGRQHFSRPAWTHVLEILVVVYFGLFLVFVIPRVKPRDGALILGIFLLTWIGFSVVLLMSFGYWVRIFAPVFLAVFGYGIAGFHRFAREAQRDSIELNKMLGLSFQNKGMLDMAFEKFKKCPVDNVSVRELLYSLGQDFERKRMFNKALAVYKYLQTAGRYQDSAQRIDMLESFGETASSSTPSKNGSIILNNGATKPTLGRYEIIRELGQGAMGVVYLGRDPKINREVAIKTLSYANVEQELFEEFRERFLREAEAAGRLAHPNIVTIYDVGEEHDMAYMAMELLKGKDLLGYCRKDSLMPVDRVLETLASVADALEYAHSNEVVHRDIKPDNIILLDGGQVKVADFGIARVMSASETQTGVLLGTPSYMSPEQVEGARVDGRSDLFSLGIVMYEMLSGEKPFKGDNLANMMYAISNVTFTPLKKIVPNIPECCSRIVNKLLRKDPGRRTASAAEVARKLRQCRANLN
jgi:serine/threonine-protein kinase